VVARAFERFINLEAASGIVLFCAAIAALLLDNSPLAWLYDSLLTTPMVIQIGALVLDKPILLWINDGLMAIFFLLVGLEIKREILRGQLSSREQIALPGFAAIGGMLVPALVYLLVVNGNQGLANGWAIPAATDIAFALGVLALLGNRVPPSLKVFLLALAIIDDLGAIIIIALFYTSDLSAVMLLGASVAVVALTMLNRLGVSSVTPYVLIGVALWLFVLKSGVHATLAGVVLGFAIPLNAAKSSEGHSPLENMEHKLQPWVAFGIMPIFAFANAGVSLQGFSLQTLLEPLPLGIALGLFFGKQLGIFGAVWLSIKLGLAKLPRGANWGHIYGVACLGGIGFTMSLSIGTLAFADSSQAAGVRFGVLFGSIASAGLGYALLRFASLGSATNKRRSASLLAADGASA
jgi:NhaA family Na+:H+ antiporter